MRSGDRGKRGNAQCPASPGPDSLPSPHDGDLGRRPSTLVPRGVRESREELQQNFKAVLQSGLAKLDLVTREEFEVQREVLLRTREKLEALQATVAELEAQLAQSEPLTPRH